MSFFQDELQLGKVAHPRFTHYNKSGKKVGR